jgi:hypothetical protein
MIKVALSLGKEPELLPMASVWAEILKEFGSDLTEVAVGGPVPR